MDRRPEIGALKDRSVGELVAEDYSRAAVLKGKGIDFCCGGGRTVEEACERAGIAVAELERALAAADRSGPKVGGLVSDPRRWDLDFLADYIVRTHHRYVRESLPVLRQFSEKLARVHGEAHPELVAIRELVSELAREMEAHMEEEEEGLFPTLRSPTFGPATMDALESLREEHDRAGSIVREIRSLSGDFTPPDGACATHRATYAKLEEFEEDLHLHVHLENNVLFPAVAERGDRPAL